MNQVKKANNFGPSLPLNYHFSPLKTKTMSKATLTILSFLSFFLLFSDEVIQAQSWTSASGGRLYVNPTSTKVGIGTAYPYGSYRLSISGGASTSGMYVSGYPYAGFFAGDFGTSGNIKGNEYSGTFNIYANSSDNSGAYLRFYGKYHSANAGSISITSYDQGETEFYSRTASGWAHHMTIHPSSKISIGTKNTPTTIGGANISSYRLFVKGGVLTDELRVRTGWADYVFESDYDLTSLSEVEAHIASKGHLHNTPSAKQVEAEGIEIGEMTKNQQEKIEEVFLHLIALEKRIARLEAENAKLKSAE